MYKMVQIGMVIGVSCFVSVVQIQWLGIVLVLGVFQVYFVKMGIGKIMLICVGWYDVIKLIDVVFDVFQKIVRCFDIYKIVWFVDWYYWGGDVQYMQYYVLWFFDCQFFD